MQSCKWDNCHNCYGSAKELYSHVVGNHIKKLTCGWEGCTYSCKRFPQLISHVIVHIPYYPHKCKYCPKKFKRKHDRGKHFTSMHSSDLTNNQLSSRDYASLFGPKYKTSLEFILN